MNTWPVETIPDGDRLLYRVHRMWLRDGAAVAGAFKDRQGAMSTDWSKYSTALESRQRGKVPSDNAIGSFIAGELRTMAHQQVAHSPLPDNRAHASVIGEKDEEARVLFSRLMRWELKLEASAPPSTARE